MSGESVDDLAGALQAAFGAVTGSGASPAPPLPRSFEGGEVAGRYRILEEIGSGGQGTVFLAEDLRLDRRVALKVLSGFGRLSAEMRRRFEREAQLASRLHRPGICAVHDYGIYDGMPFIAMQYVEGKSLAALVRTAASAGFSSVLLDTEAEDPTARGRPEVATRESVTLPDVRRIVHLLEKVALALHSAHETGIIHRDIKPGNIMVTPAGEPVVLDFGLAREMDAEGPSLTHSGDLFGTPAYMSPEQLAPHHVPLDGRTDVFSLGVTLYECLTLKRPFTAPTREGLYQAIRTKDPPDPRTLNPAIPRDLKVVLETALEKDRDRRYQTASALAEDLRRVRNLEPILARAAGRWTRLVRWTQRNPALAATGAAAAMVLVAGSVVSSVLAVRAKEQAERAETHLLAYNRLAEAVVLEDLLLEEDGLWPAEPGMIPAMEAWLIRARDLASTLPMHRSALDDMRSKAGPYSEAVKAKDRASHRHELEELASGEEACDGLREELENLASADLPEARREQRREEIEEKLKLTEERLGEARQRVEPILSERLTWEFEDTSLRWRHEKLADLVRSLQAFTANGPKQPGIPGMEARLAFARTLVKRTVDDHAGAWNACRARVAGNPAYGGLQLPIQPGLIPLGPDPGSMLEEFCETASGVPPERDPATGKLAMADPVALIFVLLPGGTFMMGAQYQGPDDPDYDRGAQDVEGPVHEITLCPFLISKYEMTQGQWLHATGENPSRYRPGTRNGEVTVDLRHPVEQVSWEDCHRTLRRLGLKFPTEARWEYACRAGTTTPWSCGAEKESLVSAANLSDRSLLRSGAAPSWEFEDWDDGYSIHSPVGSLAANAFGLHDLHGNLWEWCQDQQGSYRQRTAPGDGLRVFRGRRDRILRGGSFSRLGTFARSSSRSSHLPSGRDPYLGLRPARDVDF